jgi:hypothetical protein
MDERLSDRVELAPGTRPREKRLKSGGSLTITSDGFDT